MAKTGAKTITLDSLPDPDRIRRKLEMLPASYADFRMFFGSSSLIRIKDREIEAQSPTGFGMAIRALVNGSWGFASSNRASSSSIDSLITSAMRLSRLSKGTDKLSSEKFSSRHVHVKAKVKQKSEDIGIDEKAKKCLSLSKRMEIQNVANTNVLLSDGSGTKTFVNSDGAFIEEETASFYLSLTSIAKSGSIMQGGHENIAARGGYEFMRNAEEKADIAAKKAVRMLSAKPAKKGSQTIVVDGKMAGVFAHEALGHAAEADAILADNSILKGKIGKKIGSPLVSIYDDATAEGFGKFAYDDEGMPGQKKLIVGNGVLRGFLHSRATAGELGVHATGNCRAGSYADFPIVRMSNTYFAKGETSHEDIFDIRSGIYLKGMNGGSVEPLGGTFVFTAEEGYVIENGELGSPLRDAMVSGHILEALHRIEAVGKDFEDSPGFCGKMGQSVPVSDGGPHLRINGMLIG